MATNHRWGLWCLIIHLYIAERYLKMHPSCSKRDAYQPVVMAPMGPLIVSGGCEVATLLGLVHYAIFVHS